VKDHSAVTQSYDNNPVLVKGDGSGGGGGGGGGSLSI